MGLMLDLARAKGANNSHRFIKRLPPALLRTFNVLCWTWTNATIFPSAWRKRTLRPYP